MEFKHFSHNHALIPHQIPQPSNTLCSGCNSPASGDSYACSECNFFLHHQCYHAPRSLNHPSHPLHPLTLMPFPTYPSQSFICNSCNVAGAGFSYSCSECQYDAHLHCALTPSTTPSSEATQWPESVTRPDHEHPLSLHRSSPYPEAPEGVVFVCDACGECVDTAAPMYCCRDCDFGTHVECVQVQVQVVKNDAEEIAVQMVRQQQQLQLQLQMMNMNMNNQLQMHQLQRNMNSQLHMQVSGLRAGRAHHIKDSI